MRPSVVGCRSLSRTWSPNCPIGETPNAIRRSELDDLIPSSLEYKWKEKERLYTLIVHDNPLP